MPKKPTGRNRGGKPDKEPFQEDAKYDYPKAVLSTAVRQGPPTIYSTQPSGAEALWKDCQAYFETREAFRYLGGNNNNIPLPFTIVGLCLYLGIDRTTWYDWKKSRPDLSHIITRAEAVIEDQQFSGAMVGAYNSNIVARKLGLTDKQEIKHTADPEVLSWLGDAD